MPIATTNLALPRLRLMELVAACPTFRTVVGAADSAEAMVHILSPYADDHLVDTMFEGSPVLDGAGNKVQELKEPRPRAIINHNEYDRQLLGTAFGASKINHILCFEFLPDPAAGADINVGLALFEEQVGWATDAGVDFIIAETFSWGEEALIALDVIRRSRKPAVITMSVHRKPETREGWTLGDCCKRLEDAGADVVGVNCARGPATMIPLLKEIRDAVSVHVAALPVPYRTTEQQPTFQSLRDPACGCLPREMPFPEALDPFTCNRYEIAEFAKNAYALGVNYLGVCCGASPHHIRSMAEALGKSPPASRYSTDM